MVAYRIGTEKIQREKGYLYYLDNDGYLTRTPIMLNTKGVKGRVGTEKINRIDGCMYFLDKNGYVSAVILREANDGGIGRFAIVREDHKINALKEEHRRLLMLRVNADTARKREEVFESIEKMASDPDRITAKRLRALARKLE